MKFKTNELSFNLVLAGSPLTASIPAFAVTEDTDRSTHIESGQQSLDMQDSVITFTGSVIVTQGTIKINADKVVVTRPGDEQGKGVTNGYGKPATPYQMRNNGKPVEGHTPQIHYEPAKDFVTLTSDTYLQQIDSNIKGDKIIYLTKEQKMQAFNDRGKHITAVLVPSQLQGKNNKGRTLVQKKDN